MTWITTNGDGTAYFYAIQNLKTRKYCRLDDGTGRYAGNIQMDDLDADDRRFWFNLEPDSDNKCFIRNRQTGQPAAINSSYIDISGKKEATPFTLTFNDDHTGIIIANDDNYWTTQTSGQMYAQIRKTPSEWRFVYVGEVHYQDVPSMFEETDAAPFFDLSGRRVDNPTRGLYIQKGKKVYIK